MSQQRIKQPYCTTAENSIDLSPHRHLHSDSFLPTHPRWSLLCRYLGEYTHTDTQAHIHKVQKYRSTVTEEHIPQQLWYCALRFLTFTLLSLELSLCSPLLLLFHLLLLLLMSFQCCLGAGYPGIIGKLRTTHTHTQPAGLYLSQKYLCPSSVFIG